MSPENTHKLMGFYMEGLILGVNTMYMHFCFFKLFLVRCIGLKLTSEDVNFNMKSCMTPWVPCIPPCGVTYDSPHSPQTQCLWSCTHTSVQRATANPRSLTEVSNLWLFSSFPHQFVYIQLVTGLTRLSNNILFVCVFFNLFQTVQLWSSSVCKYLDCGWDCIRTPVHPVEACISGRTRAVQAVSGFCTCRAITMIFPCTDWRVLMA